MFRLFAEAFFQNFACGEVDYSGEDHGALGGLDGAETYLYRNLGAVFEQGYEVAAAAHGARFRLVEKGGVVVAVAGAEALRDDDFQGLAEDFGVGIAEQVLELGVDHVDEPGGVDHEERGGGGIDDGTEQGVFAGVDLADSMSRA